MKQYSAILLALLMVVWYVSTYEDTIEGVYEMIIGE